MCMSNKSFSTEKKVIVLWLQHAMVCLLFDYNLMGVYCLLRERNEMMHMYSMLDRVAKIKFNGPGSIRSVRKRGRTRRKVSCK